MTAALRVEALRVVRESRRGRFVLTVPDLSLPPGEVLAVLGPNGAGKSTLLRVLAGLEAPVSGRLISTADGPVTLVFQRPIAFAGSVHHNVRVALRARGLARDEIERRVADALGHFGIAALAARRASRLSGGELRRLALARAFALEPAVLLLDEPFDDLDTAAQETLSHDLRVAVARTRVAVAVVTHDLRRALRVADRIAVLENGALVQADTRDRVLAHPATASIARLVGMTNLIAATISGDQAIVDGEHRVPLARPGTSGAPVWLGLRPEHLKLDAAHGEDARDGRGHAAPPTVAIGKATVLSRGSDGVLTTLELGWADRRLRTHLVAGRGLDRTLRVGSVVSLALRPDDVHVMPRDDADDGRLDR